MLLLYYCRRLKAAGQKLGASVAVLHLQRIASNNKVNQYTLQLANVGDVEAVLCRRGEALPLTRKFVTVEDREECDRVYNSNGIITEVLIHTHRIGNEMCV